MGVLISYITEHLDNEDEMLRVEQYSDDYVDTVLKKSWTIKMEYGSERSSNLEENT